jgi:membrane protease subunit (stomatin/prohibitin family)
MAIIDIVRYESNDSLFVWKYPSQDLKLGSQLVVNTSQTAFFVKGGKIFDEFGPGTTTLTSGNLPLINKVVNLPFGGNSPFQAEVWYVNLISKLDNKWGTPSPIQLEDPKYNVIVPLRAFGQFGISVDNPRLFLETLVGNMTEFTTGKILDYFKGKVISSFTSTVGRKIIHERFSVLELSAYTDELSEYCKSRIGEEFSKYGLRIDNFYILSLNIPDNDPSIIKLKEAKDLAAKVKIAGRDIYQMDRSFDVMDKAAQNENGISGTLMTAGMGLSAGLGIGNQLGQTLVPNNTSQSVNTTPPPPQFVEHNYFILLNNQQVGPLPIEDIKNKIFNRTIDVRTYVWRPGMDNWVFAIDQAEISDFFKLVPPTPPR